MEGECDMPGSAGYPASGSGRVLSRAGRRPGGPHSGQVQEVGENLAERVDGERQVALAGQQMSACPGEVIGQPGTVGEGDHPVLVALPDRDGRAGALPAAAQRESPVPDEGQVIVPPAGDAAGQRGTERGGEVLGELPADHRPVRLGQQFAHPRR